MNVVERIASLKGEQWREFTSCELRGYLTLSRQSALEVNGVTVGIHVIVSYDNADTKELNIGTRGELLAAAYVNVMKWKEDEGVLGEVALAQQELGWGTQAHFHVHFFIAETEKLSTYGLKPRRYVDPESRLVRI